MNKVLTQAERQLILSQIDQAIADSQLAVNIVKDYITKNKALARQLRQFRQQLSGSGRQ